MKYQWRDEGYERCRELEKKKKNDVLKVIIRNLVKGWVVGVCGRSRRIS